MDFLGTVTTADLVASVTSGVQDTGESLWPLLIFVGIGVAFTLFGFVVSIIRKSIGGKKQVINGQYMITVNSDIITTYSDFVSGSVTGLLPLIGITAGLFIAFMIFDRVVRIIIKSVK